MIVPTHSSGTSIQTVSYGSSRWPFSCRSITVGRDTSSSKPSRRIVSTSTATCIAPRALTLNTAARSVSSIWMETLVFTSRNSRSRSWRDVTSLSVLADQRTVVDAELHLQRRRIDLR